MQGAQAVLERPEEKIIEAENKEFYFIVCGYGKIKTENIENYIRFVLEKALKLSKIFQNIVKVVILFSGGNTSRVANGPWNTEAEMMELIAEKILSELKIPSNLIFEFIKEENSFNTITNIKFSKQKLENYIHFQFTAEIIKNIKVFCNRTHKIKVFFALLKIFGRKAFLIEIFSFPVIKEFFSNIKILLYTIPEVIGYFVPWIGKIIEDKQLKMRILKIR